MHRKRARRIVKKSVWVLRSEEEGGLSLARSGLVPHMLVGRWKSQHRKIVPLSPYVEKPLNSKVIKGYVAELRSRKCFSCFGIHILCVYMVMNILWSFHTHPYIWLRNSITFGVGISADIGKRWPPRYRIIFGIGNHVQTILLQMLPRPAQCYEWYR